MVADTRPTPDVTLVGVRVPVVEDDDDSRELFKVVLETTGAVVVTAGSAHEGLSEFHHFRPDVVVSDLYMPDADGCWLVRRVRAVVGAADHGPAAMAVTADHGEHVRQRCLAAGFDVVLTKPIEPVEFCAAVERLARAAQAS